MSASVSSARPKSAKSLILKMLAALATGIGCILFDEVLAGASITLREAVEFVGITLIVVPLSLLGLLLSFGFYFVASVAWDKVTRGFTERQKTIFRWGAGYGVLLLAFLAGTRRPLTSAVAAAATLGAYAALLGLSFLWLELVGRVAIFIWSGLALLVPERVRNGLTAAETEEASPAEQVGEHVDYVATTLEDMNQATIDLSSLAS